MKTILHEVFIEVLFMELSGCATFKGHSGRQIICTYVPTWYQHHFQLLFCLEGINHSSWAQPLKTCAVGAGIEEASLFKQSVTGM